MRSVRRRKPASPAAESGSAGAAASQAEKNAQTTPSVDGIESIQAYTDGTIYGTGVVEVDVSYRDGVDLSSITPDSYILEDHGSLSPEFGTLRISGASVDGNTVKLMISNLPQATENNQLVYTGDGKTGARERNAFGIYCTGSWYRDESGDIHFGRTDTEHYKANTTGMGWQARHCLELKLRHAGEAEDKAVCLADEKGEYASGGLWKETVDRQFGEDGFRSIYDLKITSTGNNASDGTGDPCVFALEPGDSGWKSAEEEQPYLEAALTAYNDRTWYSNYSTSYMAGYGKGGSALQAFAMAHPTGVISAVFADASDIPDDYISRTGMMTNDAQTDILKNAIPLPVWEINAGDAVKSYWLRANYCELSDGQADGDATVFTQKASCLPTSYMKSVKAQVRLQSGEVPSRTPEFTEKAYAFMSAYTRYENIWANGNALLLRPDYEELGVEFKTLEDAEGYTREYMVYVPEAIRGSDRIPMVLLMAGNTQTDRVFFDSTAWWQVADDNGFMIVVPCEQYNTAANMTWNITGYQQGSKSAILDDVDFVKKVLEATERDYKVDTSRRYVSGQSFGSMWTNYCAVYMSDYFTAFGSTSGPISFAIDENAATTPVPVWLFAGEHDIFDWDFNKDVKEGFSLKNTVQYYLKRNGLGELADAVEESNGRYTTYTWSTADGVPAYRFTQTGGRNHNCIPSEARKIYEEWLSLWEKDENGKRLFNGAELK
ncbi:MAG: alpha/beta hydrolase family esterase [Stomatobaculum sp.]